MDHVLMVDDDVELCALVQEYLTAEGFSLKAVHDGEKGLQQALTNEYSLVVLDVMLPGMNGFEVPRRIRSVSKIPVLLLPARGEDVDRIVGLEIGADDYLPKPFNPRELVAVGPKAVVAVTSAAKADIEAASIAALKRCATPNQGVSGSTVECGGGSDQSSEAGAADEFLVEGDPDLLRSAVENVIRNATRYTAEGTTVEVRLERRAGGNGDPGEIIVRVADSGPGVPGEALQKIFEPFYRLDDARNRQTGGAGLGLSIADRAIRLHGGQLRASNRNEGGLEVEIRIPAASAV